MGPVPFIQGCIASWLVRSHLIPSSLLLLMTFIPGRAVGNKSDHGHESTSDDVNRIEYLMEPRLQDQTLLKSDKHEPTHFDHLSMVNGNHQFFQDIIQVS